jgi:predicted metal-dependent peptidase
MAKTVDVCCSLDTSGSISDAIFTAFLSEVKGIVEQYEDFRLHIWCIDAAIYNPQVFTPENIDELDTYEPAGGGGNDFPLNWTYMMENDIEPEVFVVFSDGYPCGSWGDPEYCKTIFVIKNDWDKNIEAPFGLTVYMDDTETV